MATCVSTPIARLYAKTRVTRIYGGTSEVMKTIIAKDLGYDDTRRSSMVSG
jgi:alkylation response protein AidB-like acyl-CoA dehydrogenase